MQAAIDAGLSISGNVGKYLESLPRATLDQLYTQPATCLAVLRMLPSLAKHTVLRLLYTSSAVRESVIESWAQPEHSGIFLDILGGLSKLHIVSLGSDGGKRTVSINVVFQTNLHNALVGSGAHSSFGLPSESSDKHRPTTAFLDRYATECWESVLHYLVGTPSEKRPKSPAHHFRESTLTLRRRTDGELRITSKGFQFLLQDQLNMQLVEVLNFFFQLGSLELGQDYSIETLTPTQKHMLDDLKHLGLIYQRKKKSTRFYPTRLATSLTSGSSMSVSLTSRDQAAESEGFIIVETNYRVYAYTNSPLQIAVLSLFVSMRVRFANMVIGLITRDSVRDALAKGITSDQIIAYLTTHAHPEMRKSSPVIPSTIVDQIRLWEMERNRLRISRGYLYQMFSREQDYRDILKQATDFGYELWHSDAKRLIVVSNEGHEHIKAFVARQRQQQQQQQQQR
ncbi:RNA polymerase II transcription factor B 52 kDa subunit [Polyrhizophydium stewartii]|uniref:RNA polymerase II transcription factor B subunit 2 n=1 Tax=Polyrhizophydium stewartii TaxID=2732419 RepID=A0ABR4N796_9FUNG